MPRAIIERGLLDPGAITLTITLTANADERDDAAGIGTDSCSQYVYDHEGCAIGYGALGLIAGATTAVIVDAAVLARELVPAAARDHAMFLFTPMRSGGGLTVVGRF